MKLQQCDFCGIEHAEHQCRLVADIERFVPRYTPRIRQAIREMQKAINRNQDRK